MGNLGPGELLILCLLAGLLVAMCLPLERAPRARRGARRGSEPAGSVVRFWAVSAAQAGAVGWIRAIVTASVVFLGILALNDTHVRTLRSGHLYLALTLLIALTWVGTSLIARQRIALFRAGLEMGPPRRWIGRNDVVRVDAIGGGLQLELQSGERVSIVPWVFMTRSTRRQILDSVRATLEPALPDRPLAAATTASETERVIAAWLATLAPDAPIATLAMLGEGGARGYRDAALPRDNLWAHLESEQAAPRTRAAAAAALLGAAKPAGDRARVSALVSAMPEGPLRAALGHLVAGDDAAFLRDLRRLSMSKPDPRPPSGSAVRRRRLVTQRQSVVVAGALLLLVNAPLLLGSARPPAPSSSRAVPGCASDDAIGIVVAETIGGIGTRHAGRVVDTRIQEGAHVDAGDTLFVLDVRGDAGGLLPVDERTITSPIRGTVVRVPSQPGSWVESTDVMTEVVDDDTLFVEVEEELGPDHAPVHHAVGEACDLRFEHHPDEVVSGRVFESTSVDAAPDAGGGGHATYGVRVDPSSGVTLRFLDAASVWCGKARALGRHDPERGGVVPMLARVFATTGRSSTASSR